MANGFMKGFAQGMTSRRSRTSSRYSPSASAYDVKQFVVRHAVRNMDTNYKGDKYALTLPFDDKNEPLYKHQKEAIRAILNEPHILLNIFARGGKTRIVLEAIKLLKKQGKPYKTVVVCYNEVSISEWATQCAKYVPDLRVGFITSINKEKRIEQARAFDGDIFLTTYGQLFSILSQLVRTRNRKGKTVRKFMLFDDEYVQSFAAKFNIAVFDESREICSPNSSTFRMCTVLAYKKSKIILMSATPFSNDPSPLWSQGYVMDLGETFGPTFFGFQRLFYTKKSVPFGSGFVCAFNRKYSSYIGKLFKNVALTYDSTEVGADFPPVSTSFIGVPMGLGAHSRSYLSAKNKFIVDIQKVSKVNRVLNLQLVKSVYSASRQICSGFIYMDNKNGSGEPIRFFPIPKMDETVNLVKEIHGHSKVVIFFWFKESGRQLQKEMDKIKVPHVAMFGGENGTESYQRFQNDPNCRVLLANSEVGGVGFNLSVADYIIFYEPPNSFYNYYQATQRILVPGKKRPVFIYNLFTKNTVEERIYASFREGRDFWGEVMQKNMDIEDQILGDA